MTASRIPEWDTLTRIECDGVECRRVPEDGRRWHAPTTDPDEARWHLGGLIRSDSTGDYCLPCWESRWAHEVMLTNLRPGQDRVLVCFGDHVCEHATQLANEVVDVADWSITVEQFPVTVRVRSVERRVDFDRTFMTGESAEVPFVPELELFDPADHVEQFDHVYSGYDAVVDDSFFERSDPFDLSSPPRKRRRWWQVWR